MSTDKSNKSYDYKVLYVSQATAKRVVISNKKRFVEKMERSWIRRLKQDDNSKNDIKTPKYINVNAKTESSLPKHYRKTYLKLPLSFDDRRQEGRRMKQKISKLTRLTKNEKGQGSVKRSKIYRISHVKYVLPIDAHKSTGIKRRSIPHWTRYNIKIARSLTNYQAVRIHNEIKYILKSICRTKEVITPNNFSKTKTHFIIFFY